MRPQLCSVTHKTHPFAGEKRQQKTDNDAIYRRAVSHVSKEEARLFLAERDTDEDTAQHGQRAIGDRRLCLVSCPTSGVLGSRRALLQYSDSLGFLMKLKTGFIRSGAGRDEQEPRVPGEGSA